ncbi:MAG: hypothetical protein F6K34_01130 [Okeania sp. SIO4D6]|uniref:hypothetical protein n=1 Tax=Okeania sp. SIO2G5 TaxID=2607796 RepID=UPI0013C1D3CA|nr:hypothetical protein [Okeania sp. SIO2G5]NEP03532.1 hypothetical protein [Okeania sp. SIO4D6]NEP76006.1 hypothetical protein [Okeania sp. SIO2G5]
MNKETALDIIKENYPYQEFKQHTTEILLENSKGSDYRPYYVAAYLIKTEYRKVNRVDEVYMEYPSDVIEGLLKLQTTLDKDISDIPPEHGVEDLLSSEDIIEFSTITGTLPIL